MLDFVLYLLGCLLFLMVTEKYRRATFGMVVLIAMLYPFVAEINQFSLFIQIKYYSVIIPTVLFSFTKCKPHFTGEMVEKVFAFMPSVLRFTLALNIAEAAVYVAVFDKFVTAFFGVVLILTIPKFSYDENQDIAFEDHWWVIAYSACLTIGLFFHPEESMLTSSGIAILAIAISVAVMILSVFILSGFKDNISSKVIGFGSHIKITKFNNNQSFENDPIDFNVKIYDEIKSLDFVSHINKYATKAGIIKTKDEILDSFKGA